MSAGAAGPAMLSTLRALVACESPSNSVDDLQRCAALLSETIEDATGRPTETVEVDGRPHLSSPSAAPRVLLLGHFDTVWPVGTIDEIPFSIEDGIARGPGVFDMKAGIVQMLTAAKLLDNAEHVSILLTSDEEIGSPTSRELILEHARLASAVLVFEPSADGGAVKVGRKGIANYDVVVRGRAAHSGLEPHLGVNAGVELAHQVLAINQFGDADTSVTPTVLSAGTTTNTVPESANCHVDVRGWTMSDLERIDRTMHALAPQTPGAILEVRGGIERPPFETHSADAVYRELCAAANDLGVAVPAAVRSAGGSDANFTAAAGVPTLDGLGAIGAHPHGRDEHVDVRFMPERAALLAALVARLTNREESTS